MCPQVEDWLECVLGGDSIPRYEINPTTLDSLHQLMHRNQQQDAYTALRIEDSQQKANEYSVEGA